MQGVLDHSSGMFVYGVNKKNTPFQQLPPNKSEELFLTLKIAPKGHCLADGGPF